MWLTRLALRNPVLILMMSLMSLVLGLVSLQRLSVDLFPEINIPNVRIATFYSGAGPEDVEKAITPPIERAVSAAPGVDRVESTSKQGASLVTVWFQYGTNLDTFSGSERTGGPLSLVGGREPVMRYRERAYCPARCTSRPRRPACCRPW